MSMSNKTPTPTIEDYLGVIYTLQRDGEEVYGARLADLLEVSPPTVTVTLRRMVRDGWIRLDSSKKVFLTKTGILAAKAVIRRHMLTEWMLSKILGVPWSEVHEEADKIEHSISSGVEQSLLQKLKDPELCPHGNPMPGAEAISDSWNPITELKVGEKLIIRRIHEFLEDDQELLKFLETHHVIPGTSFIVKEFLPFNKTLTLINRDEEVTLGFDIAGSIYVEKI